LVAGVVWGGAIGLFVGLAVFVIANTTQTAWLWYRSRPAEQVVRKRDLALENASVAEATTD
jgi:hypothetical protein